MRSIIAGQLLRFVPVADGKMPCLVVINRLFDGLTSQLKIRCKLVTGEEQTRAVGIEITQAMVCRQLTDIDLDTQQFAKRVAIFAPIQAAHGDLAVPVVHLQTQGHHRLPQVIHKICLLLCGQLLLIFRRHLARIQGIENLLPTLGRGRISNGEGKVVDPEFSLLAVAIQTVCLQCLKMRIVDARQRVACLIRTGCRCEDE